MLEAENLHNIGTHIGEGDTAELSAARRRVGRARTHSETTARMSTSVPLALVRTLRDESGASMKDCKAALVAASLDLDRARRILSGAESSAAVPAAPTPMAPMGGGVVAPGAGFTGGGGVLVPPAPTAPSPVPSDDPFAGLGSADYFGSSPCGMQDLSAPSAPAQPAEGGGGMFAGMSTPALGASSMGGEGGGGGSGSAFGFMASGIDGAGGGADATLAAPPPPAQGAPQWVVTFLPV